MRKWRCIVSYFMISHVNIVLQHGHVSHFVISITLSASVSDLISVFSVWISTESREHKIEIRGHWLLILRHTDEQQCLLIKVWLGSLPWRQWKGGLTGGVRKLLLEASKNCNALFHTTEKYIKVKSKSFKWVLLLEYHWKLNLSFCDIIPNSPV